NRYRNSLAFTDDAVADLLERLDPRRNLAIVTSDHGNSFYDDGSWMHLGPLSEIQTRVALAMRGPGLPVGAITRAANHTDLPPTLYSPGVVDANATLNPSVHARPEEAGDWAAALATELERIVR